MTFAPSTFNEQVRRKATSDVIRRKEDEKAKKSEDKAKKAAQKAKRAKEDERKQSFSIFHTSD
jgi:hypothetical protein